MDQLKAIKYFVKVAQTGSFTQAANLLSMPPSSLSRRVADLEKSLGATLLKRTTRRVTLTEIGQEYYQQVGQILTQLEQTEEAVRSYQEKPMGHLRISSMTGFGERILLPLLDRFNERYPDIVLDVSLSDELSTLGRDDVDLAIRGGYAPNERVVAIELMKNNFIAVAAPDYLDHRGDPNDAQELRHHQGLYYRTPAGPNPWLCEIDGQWQDVSAPALAISNSGLWLIEKAIKGQGILMLPLWVLAPYLASGKLRELRLSPQLCITQNPDFAIYLLYLKQRYRVPKIKTAVDFLVEHVQEHL